MKGERGQACTSPARPYCHVYNLTFSLTPSSMISLFRITLFLASVGWASAEELGSSATAFQHAETETPEFSGVIKALNVEPLTTGNSTTVVRMVSDSGWAVSFVLTVPISADRQRSTVAELKIASFDDRTNGSVIKTVNANLTPSESALLRQALSSGRSFKGFRDDRSSHAIDGGWSFIEMQTATDYKWIFMYGSGDAHSESKELRTALLNIMAHLLTMHPEKAGETTSKPGAER